MQITLRHAGTGKFKVIGTGWSWSLFLTSGFLGLPLFFRGLALWGSVVTMAWCLSLAPRFVGGTGANAEIFDGVFAILLLALSVFFGLKGNALTAKRYFLLGYEFADPEAAEARIAARRWGL